jgi:hypothetical protein
LIEDAQFFEVLWVLESGRRMPGTLDAVQFRMSDVEAAWDCVNQLMLAESEAA